MPINIFTYGSLMFPAVWQRVVSAQYQSLPATVQDFRRFAVLNDTYPGLIASPGGSVEGVIYHNVAPDDVARLDHFEGDDYRRIEIDAHLTDGSTQLVQTYLMLRPQGLSDQPWLPENFALQRFLDTYCRDKLGS